MKDFFNQWANKRIDNFAELKTLFKHIAEGIALKSIGVLYRGQSDLNYQLLPSLTRSLNRQNLSCTKLEELEKLTLEEFKKKSFQDAWMKNKPFGVDEVLYCMSIGRHLGMECRLLDWTASYEVSCFFAANKDQDRDGVIWMLFFDKQSVQILTSCSPLQVQDFCIVKAPYLIDDFYKELPLGELRRRSQNGMYTITSISDSLIPLNELTIEGVYLLNVTITPKCKKEITEGLGVYMNSFLHLKEETDIIS